jgi:hypothetical protein
MATWGIWLLVISRRTLTSDLGENGVKTLVCVCIPTPKIFKVHFACKQPEMDKRNSKANLYPTGVKESNGVVTSGLIRPPPPNGRNSLNSIFVNKKTLITSKRLKMDGNCQQKYENRGRFYRLVTSLPVSSAP